MGVTTAKPFKIRIKKMVLYQFLATTNLMFIYLPFKFLLKITL